jgi:hypothetical protein
MADEEPDSAPSGLDPREFLRALLRISPEDAEKVRDRSPAPGTPEGQEGPVHDYGEDDAEPS